MNKIDGTIVIPGGTGFVGVHLIREFLNRGYNPEQLYSISRHGMYSSPPYRLIEKIHYLGVDLTNSHQVNRLFKYSSRISDDIVGVINLAASVGGIGANQKNPASFMLDSLLIGANLINAAKSCKSMQKAGKFVQIGTVCSYPKYAEVPFQEDDIWLGYPEETNAPYGIAKKAIMELVIACNIQYPNKFNGINLIPVNMYGPCDNFNVNSSHVIPALIRKIDNAKTNGDTSVTLWGTGEATREFLFVEDASKAIVDAFENYSGKQSVNIGTGKEISIKDLANVIADIVGYHGEINWDTSKPDGQPRRCLNVSRAKNLFGFEAETELYNGLMKTYLWYKKNEDYINSSK